MENLVEWTVLAGETEVLGENLGQRHFAHHKSHLPDPGANPGHRGGKPATNRLSFGSADVVFVKGNVALEQIFSECFGFPSQASFHQLLHSHKHLSSEADAIGH
jgi:hypothetical protein